MRERIDRLGGALLRITGTLDLDTVLQEVVDSARVLTGARIGVITTVDESGRPQRFLSSGITPDQHRRLAEWDEGRQLFEHLRSLPGQAPFHVASPVCPGHPPPAGGGTPVTRMHGE